MLLSYEVNLLTIASLIFSDFILIVLSLVESLCYFILDFAKQLYATKLLKYYLRQT